MMKKIGLTALIIGLLSGCDVPAKLADVGNIVNVGISGGDYVSEMTTDPDGFVRFPGEPTRESTDYYIIEDICGQFTTKFMEVVTGKKIIKAYNPSADFGSVYACDYYFDGNTSDVASIYLVLDYLNVENQKKGVEFMDRTVSISSEIPMENFVATQADGNINAIYFVLGPDKFIRLDRSSTKVASNEEMMSYAIKIAQKIKNYK
jgi:hypothetical protein